MAEQSQRMTRLVEDLLTLSRLENDTEPPREEKVDVPGLLESLLAEASALSGGKHVIELGEVSAGWVRVDPARIPHGEPALIEAIIASGQRDPSG